MLVYTKIVDGVRKLYGTMGRLPGEEDEELVYVDRDIEDESEEIVEPVEKDKYFATNGYTIQRASNNRTKYFDVYVVDKDNNDELVNIIPGDREAPSQKEVTKIELNTDNVKKDYNLNDKLDLTGIVVTATLKDPETGDEEQKVISKGYKSTPENGEALIEEGKVTVVISYKQKTAEFEVNVMDPDKVKIYFGLTKEIPTSLDDLTPEDVSRAALISAKRIDKDVYPDEDFVCIAIPKSVGTINTLYINDDTSLNQWTGFAEIPNDEYQFAYSKEPYGVGDLMVHHFLFN